MSVLRVRTSTFTAVLCTALLLATFATSAVGAQDVCEGAGKITNLGNPTTRFSSPVTTVEGLQNLMTNARADVGTLLREAGFEGDPDDFFKAVASGEGVSKASFAPGTRLEWMFARKMGQPELKRNVCWAGKEDFGGFEVQFTSRGKWYLFVVPEDCGNLSFLAEHPEPVCKVTISDSAGDTCQDKTITVNATGSSSNVKVELVSPSGTRTLTSSNSSTPLRWTVSANETSGTFKAIATASEETVRGNVLTCRAEDSVQRDCCIAGPPSITLSASPETVLTNQESTVSGSPNVSECTNLESVTMDGNAVASPYRITVSYPEPGVYTIDGSVTDGLGQTATDSVQITVVEPEPEFDAWILRTWLSKVDMDDEVRLAAEGDRRESFHLDGGNGLGVQLERRFSRRVGLGFGLMLHEAEVMFELDIGPIWAMETDDVKALTAFVGPVFHLSPEGAVDVIFSPFVGYTDVGTADITTIGNRVQLGFDNDISWGAMLGLDIPFGSWGLHGSAIYQAFDYDSDYRNVTLGADPLSLNLGLRFSF